MPELEGTLRGGLTPEEPGEITNPIEQLQTELAGIAGEGEDRLAQLNQELAQLGEGEQAPVAREVPGRPSPFQTFFATLGGTLSGDRQLSRTIQETLRRGELASEQAISENEAARLSFENEQRQRRFDLGSLINQRMLEQQVRSGELKEASATLKAQDKLERDRDKEQEVMGRESTRLRIQEQMKADLALIQARGVQKRTTAEFEADLQKLQNAFGVPREVAQLMDNVTQGLMRGANAEVTSKGQFALLGPGEAASIFAQATNRSIQTQARIARMFHAGQLDPANPPEDLLIGGPVRERVRGRVTESTTGPGALSPEDIEEIERLGRE
jgi:hypothetical protein